MKIIDEDAGFTSVHVYFITKMENQYACILVLYKIIYFHIQLSRPEWGHRRGSNVTQLYTANIFVMNCKIDSNVICPNESQFSQILPNIATLYLYISVVEMIDIEYCFCSIKTKRKSHLYV